MSLTRLGKLMAVCAALATVVFVIPASAESKARIVRLSEVQGTVQIDRTAGDGFEKAFLNLPLIEGCRLKTGRDGRAEVEFEDGSALRLTADSEVKFTRLALADSGQKLTAVQLLSGVIYADVMARKADSDQFQLNFLRESVAPQGPAHFRVDLAEATATVAVFKGKVEAVSPAGTVEVSEKHSGTIDLVKDNDASASATFVLAKGYEQDPSDAWDRQQADYHDRYASTSGSRGINSPYAYGMSDLNYYGNFMPVPGYGMMWQPYFVDASWGPFMDGGWAFYPGIGYTWVSGYPWGWMPYAYGSWAFVPGYGWMWQPGYFGYYTAIPRVVNPPVRTVVPTPPVRGHSTVLVGRGLSTNPPIGMRRITIQPDSAGLGVPRGSVDHLDKIARKAGGDSHPVTVTSAPPRTSPGTPVFGGGRGSMGTTTAPLPPPRRTISPAPPRH